MVISKVQGQSFYRDGLYLLNLFFDTKKFIFRFMFKICIVKRKLYQINKHLRKVLESATKALKANIIFFGMYFTFLPLKIMDFSHVYNKIII